MAVEDIDEAIVTPQDPGMAYDLDGFQDMDPDWTSAGHVGGLLGYGNTAGFSEGLDVSVQWDENGDNPEFQVGEGTAFLLYDGTIRVQDQNGDYSKDWENGVLFTVDIPAMDNWISLGVGEVSNIYVSVDRVENNGAYFEVLTAEEIDQGEEPDHDLYLHIARVNEMEGSATIDDSINRRPEGEFRNFEAYEAFDIRGTDYTQAPNLHMPRTDIPDGSYASQPIFVPDGKVCALWLWGMVDDDGGVGDLELELYDEDGNSPIASSTEQRQSDDPIEEVEAVGEDRLLSVRLNNTGSNNVTAGAYARYTVQDDEVWDGERFEESGS